MRTRGADGDTLLQIRILRRRIYPYEWVEDGKPYREFLVPARVLNAHGTIRVLDDHEQAALDAVSYKRRLRRGGPLR